MLKLHHRSKYGRYYIGDSVEVLRKGRLYRELRNNVQLIFTSPPFPLNKKKKYGNLQGQEYKDWFISLSEIFSELLTEDGSIVIELGNSWVEGRPVQSLLHLESLIGFVENPKSDLRLCQEFICYNPSRLPSPAEWVTVKRIRTVDSFTRLWWMSKTDFPKADNRKILRPYSKSMLSLLKKQKYNSGKRPSEHKIGETSFLNNNGGSIIPNIIELDQIEEGKDPRLPCNLRSYSNTNSNNEFLRICKKRKIKLHPARMPQQLPHLFINFLTDSGDIILDPFAGSNTTGATAECLGRKWIAIEAFKDYAKQAQIRLDLEKQKRKEGTYGSHKRNQKNRRY